MPNTLNTRIYISAMETEVAGEPRFDAKASELLARLRDAGYMIYWEKQFREYEIIEQEIAASDALLAIVDETWRSSTWMGSEFTWANGGWGAMETPNSRINPIPVFLYPATEINPWFPFNYAGPLLLARDIEQAIHQIQDLLPPRRAV